MLAHLLIIASLLLQTSTSQPAAKSPTSRVAPTTTKDTDADPAALLKVKRVYVDSFGDDAISREDVYKRQVQRSCQHPGEKEEDGGLKVQGARCIRKWLTPPTPKIVCRQGASPLLL